MTFHEKKIPPITFHEKSIGDPLEWILQNQAGLLMLFTQQKSFIFTATEIFQTVKEV